jgi:two-component system KDP operon response regulator KdpE
MARRRTVVVVDPDIAVRRYLRRGLCAKGYQVRELTTFENLSQLVARADIDVVILDIDAAESGGTALIRSLRGISSIPIIALSARNDDNSAIGALKSGADDYIRKPFSLGETLARIATTLWRVRRRRGQSPMFVSGDLEVDFVGHRVWSRNQEVHLGPKQFEVLRVLADNAGKVVPYGKIQTRVWGGAELSRLLHLRLAIRGLRTKLEETPSKPRHFLTEPRIGYRLFLKREAGKQNLVPVA